jgi:hypothetical protein
MKNRSIIYLTLVVLISLTSCRRNKIQKTIVEIKKEAVASKSDTSLSNEEKKVVLNIKESEFQYGKFKSKVNFESPIFSQSFPANIHVNRDSAIWISVAVGIEIGRALITTDSVKVMDRINKQYYELAISELSTQFDFDLDYKLLQSLILGDLPLARGANDSLAFNSLYTSLFQKKNNLLVESQVDNLSQKLITILANDKLNGNRLGISYSDFTYIADDEIPMSILTKIDNTTKSGEPSTVLEIFHTKAEVGDVNLRLPFNIPKSYSKGSLDFVKK